MVCTQKHFLELDVGGLRDPHSPAAWKPMSGVETNETSRPPSFLNRTGSCCKARRPRGHCSRRISSSQIFPSPCWWRSSWAGVGCVAVCAPFPLQWGAAVWGCLRPLLVLVLTFISDLGETSPESGGDLPLISVHQRPCWVGTLASASTPSTLPTCHASFPGLLP